MSRVYSWFVSSTKTFQSSKYLLNHHTCKENKSFTFRINPPKINEKQSTEGLRVSQRGGGHHWRDRPSSTGSGHAAVQETRRVSQRSYKLQPTEAALFVLTVNISMMPFMMNWAGGPVECNCGGGGADIIMHVLTDGTLLCPQSGRCCMWLM